MSFMLDIVGTHGGGVGGVVLLHLSTSEFEMCALL